MIIDSIWLGIAFLLGFLMRRINFPPMIGFLIAGFVLNGLNISHGQLLDDLADIGVLLLLFTIGLKIKIKSLTDKVIWAGGIVTALISTLLFVVFLYLALYANIPLFKELNFNQIALIGFALSFSSTVFVIKILEERGNLNTSEGKVAVGVLVIQDIIAVIFLTFAKGEWPSAWAGLLILTPLLRPVLIWILKKTGHGEMLILFGFFIAILGGEIFQMVGLKSDLGALIFGIIISNHKKSNELATNLLNFKDFFLIAFFLNIGFYGLPTVELFWIGIILSLLLVIKPFIYHIIFSKLGFPVRSSYFASISLANYSEFGLIIGVFATKIGIIKPEWLVIIAIAISISFILSSLLNSYSLQLFEKRNNFICSFGHSKDYSCDSKNDICEARVFIFGMGLIGTTTYDKLNLIYPGKVLALDSDETVVNEHLKQNRKVILHDATETDFWSGICKDGVNIVVLAMTDFKANIFTLKLINSTHSNIKIFAAARFDDEVKQLKEAGAHHVFNLIEEAGKGLVNDIISKS